MVDVNFYDEVEDSLLKFMVNVMTHVKNKTNNDILKIKC